VPEHVEAQKLLIRYKISRFHIKCTADYVTYQCSWWYIYNLFIYL